jgi:hypothetical protein
MNPISVYMKLIQHLLFCCILFKALLFLEHVGERLVNVTHSGFRFVHTQDYVSYMGLDSLNAKEGGECGALPITH